MSNFNLVQTRTSSLNNLPRLAFHLPNTSPDKPQQVSSPIFFCQTGCQLDFNFKDISNCTLYNDGNFFSITPLSGNKDNYVLWNGSNVNGQEMTPFYLKEIYFTAPAKDAVGNVSCNQSIQYYISFVNEKYNNLMIVVSVIGQVNNLGTNVTSVTYKFLESLAPQIPSRGDDVELSDLQNFNVSSLLPSTQSFFSTIIQDNNVQYIIMAQIVDIPMDFLNNLVSKVMGSTQAFGQKVANYQQNAVVNPPGTIIFFNENVQPIGTGDEMVCDKNCGKVSVKSEGKGLKIGGRKCRQVEPKDRGDGYLSKLGKDVEEEECVDCEETEVWPGGETDVKIKKTIEKVSEQSFAKKMFMAIIIVSALGFIASISIVFYYQKKIIGASVGMIISLFLGIFSIISCYVAGLVLQFKGNETQKKQTWIAYLVGTVVWFFAFIYIARHNDVGQLIQSIPGRINLSGLSLPALGLGGPISFQQLLQDTNVDKLTGDNVKGVYDNLRKGYQDLSGKDQQVLKQSLGKVFSSDSDLGKSLASGKPDPAALKALKSSLDKWKKMATVTPNLKQLVDKLHTDNPTNAKVTNLWTELQNMKPGSLMSPSIFMQTVDVAKGK